MPGEQTQPVIPSGWLDPLRGWLRSPTLRDVVDTSQLVDTRHYPNENQSFVSKSEEWVRSALEEALRLLEEQNFSPPSGKPLKLGWEENPDYLGAYYPDENALRLSRTPMEVDIPLHELGHWVDDNLGPSLYDYSPSNEPQRAIANTRLDRLMVDVLGSTAAEPGPDKYRGYYEWASRPEERFARAFSQYFGQGTEWGAYTYPAEFDPQGAEWAPNDFTPISSAMEAYLRAQGIIR